jgi:methylated-DNA-protein-cysteine methyltransferase-like protein
VKRASAAARGAEEENELDRPAGSSYRAIYRVVGRIPKGRVATYGQVAEIAGLGGHARQVGYALHALPDDSSLPWQRVVNARGEVSPRSDGSPMAGLQRVLLQAEGVVFDTAGRISLRRYRWRPRSR